MFESATLKLTGWYLLILMTISLLFSIAIYQVASVEVSRRLESLQSGLQNQPNIRFPQNYDFQSIRELQAHQASTNLIGGLFYINALIFVVGGVGSYMLARRTLRPIEEAHEAQSRFTSDASHELRTPLTSMKTELEVALRDPTISKSDMRELLSSNLEEVDKLTTLSHTLLKLSKLDNHPIELSSVDFVSVVKRVIERYDKHEARVSLDAPSEAVLISADEVSIEELLRILVDNALKYSPPSSPVSVNVTLRGSSAILDITNQGDGITPDDMPHIFERFYRADSSRTNQKVSGYGLGLSLAKKIIELHHGELSVKSEPQIVTTFIVSLPIISKSQVKTQ